MTMARPLTAHARVALRDGDALIAKVATHLVEHGASIIKGRSGETVVAFEFCRGILQAGADEVLLRAEAPDPSFLHEVKTELAEHVEEFAGLAAGSILWTGDGGAIDTPPNFRLMTVAEARNVTPHMRRIRLRGEALTRFASTRHLHCKLLIPREGHVPEWPFLDRSGRFVWPGGAGRPFVRKYTIRDVNPQEGWLDIDFVLHAHAGPGSAWAARACPGDTVGLVGPGGLSVAPAARYLLAGDETALPAIARLLETLPEQSQGLALIEVADDGEEQQIGNRTAIEIRWLHRNNASPGAAATLQDAITELPPPGDGDACFVWIGCEFAAFKTLRRHVRQHWNIPRETHLVTSYWRRGWSEDGAARLDALSNVAASIGNRLNPRSR